MADGRFPRLSAVDLLLVLLLAAATVHGLWLGAAIQVLSFGGMAAGLAVGALLAPHAADLTTDPLGQVALTLGAVLGLASLLGAVGREAGVAIWGRLRRLRLAQVDAALGAGVAALATLLASWLVAGMLATAPMQGVAAAIQGSAILRTLDDLLPPAPAVFARIQGLLQSSGLPPVFAGLEPEPAERLPAPGAPVVQAALARAGPATVKIVGAGCGRLQLGSGFVAAPDLVVTNAHVVAGIDDAVVQTARRRLPATAVHFDPDLDLALLRVEGLATDPLPIVRSSVERGTAGAVLGYPGGGGLSVEPAVVLRSYNALGRDIYSRGLARRPVHEVQARVRSGNSGGPLVDGAGRVVGVVFSRSVVRDDIGFAVTSAAVAPVVDQARAGAGAVDTGACAA